MPYSQPPSLTGKPFVVLGAGTLGRRIALMWLTQGEIVHLVDPNPKALEDATAFVASTLPDVIAAHVSNGTPGTLKTFQDRTAAVENAWIVVEVVPEILSLKIDLLGELDELLPDDCILASNSSSYTGSEMFAKVKNKERLVNTHYYMPPDVLPLEVMPNPYTDPAIVSLLLTEGARHGLRMYHVRKESVGLLFNRIWAAIKREALNVVADGVSGPTEVDGIMKDVLGVHRGVFELLDSVGLDVALDIGKHYTALRPGMIPPEPAALLQSMVDAGTLGVKSGMGFYEHPPHKAISSPSADDGSLSRANLDGSEVTTIVPPGSTHTPKQLVLDTTSERLYWADREGGRLQRCALDGSHLETLYISALTAEQHTDQRTWCVGIALDAHCGLLYWTQKGGSKGSKGRIFRAPLSTLSGPIELLFDNLPEPIDLELHASHLYWTDRGDPPFGNSLNRADVGFPFDPSRPPRGPSRDLVVAERFHETIGLAIDAVGGKVYVSDLLGSLWVCDLDGRNKTAILRDAGNFSGITFHRG
ncbi:3-hydroxy-acyl-CoA dehydrogenase [Mycena chlorophos]|uniref:3-hydroxy-acyl-CoA dehydrogenase n=1 Tax=Mycena chlorophos TaxID=658473 RepID=A0A8H6TH00_MYCCL|nr:3-hydroxy-acyl-CoA dehydrogenase [Mycena chlorophos]